MIKNFKGMENSNGFDKRPEDTKKGGRKSSIFNNLKSLGYGKDDINHCFKELCFYTKSDIDEAIKDDTSPIIIQIIAKSLSKARSSGDISSIRPIIEYLLGKPSQFIKSEIATKRAPVFGTNPLEE